LGGNNSAIGRAPECITPALRPRRSSFSQTPNTFLWISTLLSPVVGYGHIAGRWQDIGRAWPVFLNGSPAMIYPAIDADAHERLKTDPQYPYAVATLFSARLSLPGASTLTFPSAATTPTAGRKSFSASRCVRGEATRTSPNVLQGSASAMIDQLEERRATFGLTYVVLGAYDAETVAPIVRRVT
jgi:hypothetical protein